MLRPKRLTDIIGNEDLKRRVQISLESCRIRGAPYPHSLFIGYSGCGKTTFAFAIANELGNNLLTVNCASVKDLSSLESLNNSTILLDEVHSLPQKSQESLYHLMEGYDDEQECTIIGATTEHGKLAEPLKNRFKYQYFLKYYTDEEIGRIIKINAEKLGVKLDDEAIMEIAKRSKSIPRRANSLLEWVRDYALAELIGVVSKKHTDMAFTLWKIDEFGLDDYDRTYLRVLKKEGQAGLKTLAAATGFDKKTIEKDIEPYLLRLGLIKKTGGGRIINL